MNAQSKAYQSDKKRRSFLPAPKKTSTLIPSPIATAPVPPTAPSPPSPAASQLQQHQHLPPQTRSAHCLPSQEPPTEKSHTPPPHSAPPYGPSPSPRKHSTEDSYGKGLRVGAHILIGGVKPGVIRYYGTTHLAQGIFCGIELFEPEGKHDGKVDGHRYFSCPPKHGIFAPADKVCLNLAALSDSRESLIHAIHQENRAYHDYDVEAVDCARDGSGERYSSKTWHRPRDAWKEADRGFGDHRGIEVGELKSYAAPAQTLPPAPCVKIPESATVPENTNTFAAQDRISCLPTLSSRLPKFSKGQRAEVKGTSVIPSLYSHDVKEEGGNSTFIVEEGETEKIQYPAKESWSGIRSQDVEHSEEDNSQRECLSTGIKRQLKADSRQYLNFTFDPEESRLGESPPFDETYCLEDNDPPSSSYQHTLDGSEGSSLGLLKSGSLEANNRSGGLLEESEIRSIDHRRESDHSRSSVSSGYPEHVLTSTPVCVGDQNQSKPLKSGSYIIESQQADTCCLSEEELDYAKYSVSDESLPYDQVDDLTTKSNIKQTTYQTAGPQANKSDSYTVVPEQFCYDDTDVYASRSYTVAESDGVGPDLRGSDSYTIREGRSSESQADVEAGYNVNKSQSYTVNTSRESGHPVLDSNSYTVEERPGNKSYWVDSTLKCTAVRLSQCADMQAPTSSRDGTYVQAGQPKQVKVVASTHLRQGSTDSSNDEAAGEHSSSSNTDGKGESSEDSTESSGVKGDSLEDSSTGISPEVSQALEWDYGQEFDGKIPLLRQENPMTISTSTSESFSETGQDTSEVSSEVGLSEIEPPMGLMDDGYQFETPEAEFENIDNIEDYEIFVKDSKRPMTDSGISDKDFHQGQPFAGGNSSSDDCSRDDDISSTTKALSSDSSQETLGAELLADTPVSVEEKELPSDTITDSFDSKPGPYLEPKLSPSVSFPIVASSDSSADSLSETDVSVREALPLPPDSGRRLDRQRDGSLSDIRGLTDQHVEGDDHGLTDGGRKERPISLISTTSADTGYVPDTDSEAGTVTNSPSEWLDRQGIPLPTSFAPLEESDVCPDEGVDASFSAPNEEDLTNLKKAVVPGGMDEATSVEDDRIEADQVDVPAKSAQAPVPAPVLQGVIRSVDSLAAVERSMTESSVEAAAEKEAASHAQSQPAEVEETGAECATYQTVKENVSKSETSKEKSENKEATSARSRKPFVVTKKKMEQIDHKLPNTTKVTSKLADYIKASVPQKPKEKEAGADGKVKKTANKSGGGKVEPRKKSSVAEPAVSKVKEENRSLSADRSSKTRESSVDRAVKPEKPKPVVKRSAPKSKWDNIMAQIEGNKDAPKPKTKSEVQSTLSAYLKAPPTQPSNTPTTTTTVTSNNAENANANNTVIKDPVQNKEIKVSRSKHILPPPPPKVDYSKVKSKLNVPTAATVSKMLPRRDRDSSPVVSRSAAAVRRAGSREASPSPTTNAAASPGKRMSDSHIVLLRKSSLGSVQSSRTDLSTCGSVEADGAPSKQSVPRAQKDLHASVTSSRSDLSEVQTTEAMNVKNVLESAKIVPEPIRPKKKAIKSTIPPFTPIKMPSRAIENKKEASQSKSKAKSKVTGRNKAGNTAREPADSNKCNQNRRQAKLSNGSAKGGKLAPGPSAAQEVVRLEALCEARTKELVQLKMLLRDNTLAFDAMATLLQYCTTELDAFSCPMLTHDLHRTEQTLADCRKQIELLTESKNHLEEELSQVTKTRDEATKQVEELERQSKADKEEHEKIVKEMDSTNNAALTTQRDELGKQHDAAVKKLRDYHDKQVDNMRFSWERQQLADVKAENKMEVNTIRISHLEEIQELRNKHDRQMEELHKQHRNKLEDITHRFESIKLSLSEKVESLRGECDELRHRARSSEEALQRDADVKVQLALAPYKNLPQEIESLKTVLEMRNEEIQKLRKQNMDLEKQLEEVPQARDKIVSLQQKVENLEAIISMKSDHEKQLHEKCQVLMKKYDKESRANKRLSMDYEQVVYRMSQSCELGSTENVYHRQVSRSPPVSEGGSPDLRRRTTSPRSGGSPEVVMRGRESACGGKDRRLKSRSATFVVERERKSPSTSPQPPQLNRRSSPATMDRLVRSDYGQSTSSSDNGQTSSGEVKPEENLLLSMSTSASTHISDSGVGDEVMQSSARTDNLSSSLLTASCATSFSGDWNSINSDLPGTSVGSESVPGASDLSADITAIRTSSSLPDTHARATPGDPSNNTPHPEARYVTLPTDDAFDDSVFDDRDSDYTESESYSFSIDANASESDSRLTSVSEDTCNVSIPVLTTTFDSSHNRTAAASTELSPEPASLDATGSSLVTLESTADSSSRDTTVSSVQEKSDKLSCPPSDGNSLEKSPNGDIRPKLRITDV